MNDFFVKGQVCGLFYLYFSVTILDGFIFVPSSWGLVKSLVRTDSSVIGYFLSGINMSSVDISKIQLEAKSEVPNTFLQTASKLPT